MSKTTIASVPSTITTKSYSPSKGKQSKSVPPVRVTNQSLSPVERLIVLTYGQNSNYIKWNEHMSHYLSTVYGQLACIMTTGNYHVEPMPAPIVPAEAMGLDDETRGIIANTVYIEKLKIWTRETADNRNKYREMFHVVWNYLSSESQLQIKDVADWADHERAQDMQFLRQRIVATHQTGEVRIGPLALNYAKHKLSTCRQGQTESLAEYKRRFDDLHSVFLAAGGREIPQAELAVDFLTSLDNHRYASLRVELENGIQNGTRNMPATLSAMYQLASTYKVVSSTGQIMSATVFRAHGQTSPSKQEKDKKPKDSVKNAESKPPRPCKHCGGDHWNNQCPSKATVPDSQPKTELATSSTQPAAGTTITTTNGIVRLTFTRSTVDCRGLVLRTSDIDRPIDDSINCVVSMDTQANVSLFNNKELLNNLRPSKTLSAEGIDKRGEPLICNMIGDFEPLGVSAYYSPDASANVLCFHDIRDQCLIEWDQTANTLTASNHNSGLSLVFSSSNDPTDPEHKLYRCDLTDYYHTPITRNVCTTVSQQEVLFSKREIDRANTSRELSRRMGFPSVGALTELLNNGGILNSPITAQDVRRSAQIYGPEVAALRGKTVKKSPTIYKEEPVPRLVSTVITLSVDIMFVLSHAFLLSVGDHIAFTMTTHLGWELGRRAKASIRRALHSHLALYKSHGFIVRFLHADEEGAIASLATELAGSHGVIVNPSGPGQHVPVVERKCREMKERARSIYHSLPFNLTVSLVVWLVLFVTRSVNMTVHKGGPMGVSPREAFLGVKLDYDRDCRVAFGDYIEATDPYGDNTLKPRTQACIALLPIGTQGTIQCLSLSTGKIIKRNQFKILPTPDFVIDHMNKLALNDSSRLGQVTDLEFRLASGPISLADLPDEPLDVLGEDFLDINVPRVIDADDLVPEEDSIVTEQRADTIISHVSSLDEPEPEDAGDTPPPERPQHVQDSDSDTESDSDITRSDVPSSDHPEAAPVVIPSTHPYGTRSSHRSGNRIVWDPRTGTKKALHVRLFKPRANHLVLRTSLQKALRDPRLGVPALTAMRKELLSLHEKGVFLPLMKGEEVGLKKPIPCHLFFKEKFTPDGVFDKLKGRLVAGGNMQDPSTVYDDISAPTAALPFIFAVPLSPHRRADMY